MLRPQLELILINQIKYEELPNFTEVAAAGTAAALVPIKSITMRSKNDKFIYQNEGDEPGPVVEKLLEQLKAIQQGRAKDPHGWREPVREYKKGEYAVEEEEVDGVAGVNGHVPGQLP